MLHVHSFMFSPFSENTYVLSTEQGDCVIVDPGNSNREENKLLQEYIETKNLKPILLLNTHCHIDHVFGNRWVFDTYGLKPQIHPIEAITLGHAQRSAEIYGLQYDESPLGEETLEHGGKINIGSEVLDTVFVPGHAPGHVAFISHDHKFVIGGDVLFQGSIGRTDLPGGDFATLEDSIRKHFYTLPEDFTVYSGHGAPTTIGAEKASNPFVRP